MSSTLFKPHGPTVASLAEHADPVQGALVQYDGTLGSKGRFLGFWSVLTQAAFS